MLIKQIFKEENNIKARDLVKHKDFQQTTPHNNKHLDLFMSQLTLQKLNIKMDQNLQLAIKEYRKKTI